MNKVILAAVLMTTCALAASAQSLAESHGTSTRADKNDRKLIYKEDPVYPQDLKRFYIGGIVRLKLVISPGGNVETVSALGGNPALVDSSIAAVKHWKYSPAEHSSEKVLNLVFDPHH